MNQALILLSCLVLCSCGSMRIFKEKVPEPIKKNYHHKDAEKKSAYLLAANAKDENKNLANALSRSLGTPSNLEGDPRDLADNLFAHTSKYEANINGLNIELENLKGKDIEGTGFNLMPLTSMLGIVAIIALVILFPSAITILFFLLKRTRSAFSNVVKGVQEFTDQNPSSAKDLNELLEKKMDRVEKDLKMKYQSYG